MEQHQRGSAMDQVFADVHAIIALLERADETTWSSRIAHTLTGSTVEQVYPLLRHELCGLSRSPTAGALGLTERLHALVTALNDALAPYGYRPERCAPAPRTHAASIAPTDEPASQLQST